MSEFTFGKLSDVLSKNKVIKEAIQNDDFVYSVQMMQVRQARKEFIGNAENLAKIDVIEAEIKRKFGKK